MSYTPVSPTHHACAAAGPDPNRYTVAFTSYLATPSTQAAENFAPMPWRTRTVMDDPSNQARAAYYETASLHVPPSALLGPAGGMQHPK